LEEFATSDELQVGVGFLWRNSFGSEVVTRGYLKAEIIHIPAN
jgi:hypothetical protein